MFYKIRLIFVLFFFCITLIHYSKFSDTFMCYWCASKGLQYNWQITGLKFPDSIQNVSNFFVDQCDYYPNMSLKLDPYCSDFCFSMMIVALNKDGSASLGDQYWIRGCHRDFTGFQFPLNLSTSVGPNGKCQYGNIVRYTDSGQSVYTPAGYGWCNSDYWDHGYPEPCNRQTYLSQFSKADPPCKVYSSNMSCYDCVEGGQYPKPCVNYATKYGSYCYKLNYYNKNLIVRSISDIDPLFPGASGPPSSQNQPQVGQGFCGNIVDVGTGQYQSKGYLCYCSTSDLCNGAISEGDGIIKAKTCFITILSMTVFVLCNLKFYTYW